jgi:hypothetical protein
MNRWVRLGLTLAVLAGVAGAAQAQGIQTGIIQGTVQDSGQAVLPGATITVSSPALQGTRSAVTDANGIYVLRGLPPGEYRVVVELSGFTTAEQTTTVELGQPAEVNTTLSLAGIQEAVTVTAETPSAVTTTTGGANYTYEEIDRLPTPRTLSGIAALAPGLTENTPNAGQVTISGGFAYDNVFLIDGVDVNDNLFGTANNLFIEDAIEQTQVLTSGISAEYGRFSGGVVNAISKSGGNKFTGSFRTNLTNTSWREENPLEKEQGTTRPDNLNQTYEGTFGGPIVRDAVWFFAAGRWANTSTSTALPETSLQFEGSNENRRIEAKGTGTLATNHTFTASYLKNQTDAVRVPFPFTIDPRSAESPSFPNDRIVGSWRGVLNARTFAEVQVSRKTFGFRDTGGTGSDLALNSPIIGAFTVPLSHYNAPYFDATDPEDRNNYQIAGNLSYFITTPNAGSHDLKGGIELFNSSRTGGNSQSPTNFVWIADYKTDAAGSPVFDGQGRLIPTFVTGTNEYENWLPEREAKIDIRTLSLFVQDRWRVGRQWSFDVGARYERVRSEATGGIVGVDTDTIVPRLAASFDVLGNGEFVLQSTYGHYAGKYSESQFANNTTVGNPSAVYAVYVGPSGEGLDFAPGFDPANYEIYNAEFPTANIFFEDGLSSPLTKEFTVSAGGRLGRGYGKATFQARNMSNFVEDFITLEGGATDVIYQGENFGTFPNVIYRNSDAPEREYRALIFEGRYPFFTDLSLNGHWTVQLRNHGNFEGEAANTPGVSSTLGDYPEIFSAARYYPTGRLNDYQRHKVRLWSIYGLGLGRIGRLDTSVIYRYDSATTFSFFHNSAPISAVQQALGAAYASLQASQSLYFGERGAGLFEDSHLVDVAVNYNIPVFSTVRPWVKFEVRNLLNSDKLIAWNTTVTRDVNTPLDALGQPTGYVRGANFGKGTANTHYPIAREYFVSFGVRF